MHTEDEHLLDELAETTALAMGIPVEDVLAPAAGLRTDEQIRSVMAQYAIARSTGRNPAEMEVPVMRQADMRTAQLAATLMNAMPKGVKDNMSDDDRRRAVTLAMQNPRQFEVFVDSVRGARGNRAMERAATDVLKANIGAGNIALASTGISGGETTNGPNGRRAMTGFDTSTNPNDRQLS